MKPLLLLPLLATCLLRCDAQGADAAKLGDTQVLKWKDGKKAAFIMGFDDSAPSQLKNAIPELEKRKMVGTFYLVTGNRVWEATKAKWEAAAKSPYVVVANHTFTHKGATSAEELAVEIEKCNEVLYALHPEKKRPYLLSFAKPGGVPWTVTNEEVQVVLQKNNLVNRPPFKGPPITAKNVDEVLAVVDQALAKGDMGYHIFHGVGGDWLATPMGWFVPLLDKLEKHRDELWITDMLSWSKYVKERETAEVKIIEPGPKQIRLALTAKADPVLFDEPLTLSTKVPADWKKSRVAQGNKAAGVPVVNGSVQYDAVPGGAEIAIQSAP